MFPFKEDRFGIFSANYTCYYACVCDRSIFFEQMTVIKVGLLAGVMLGFAYLFEYTKKRDRGKHDGS